MNANEFSGEHSSRRHCGEKSLVPCSLDFKNEEGEILALPVSSCESFCSQNSVKLKCDTSKASRHRWRYKVKQWNFNS